MPTPASIQRTYLGLLLGNTLAASLIWGINTIFLLDAGLSNFEAFAANAFFTAGMMIFEVPTGIVADAVGRRASYLLGTVTLAVTTLLYVSLWQMESPFWMWAIASILLGLGFTFFSGAVEAWLVDALDATGYKGDLESVFAKGQIVTGAAMLGGSVAGGYIAQATSLGVPFVLRAVVLVIMFFVAFAVMRDIGFTPNRDASLRAEMRRIGRESVDYGFRRKPAVRWIMLTAPFTAGVGIYAFYALQPYLLDLYDDPNAYGIAGLVAAIVAGADILGGMAAPLIRRLFRHRTTALFVTSAAGSIALALIGVFDSFAVVIGLIVVWGLLASAALPIRQAYLNGLIPSQQRATTLSFNSLLGSAGGVAIQPGLGRVADASGYPASYLVGAAIEALALPFFVLARREREPADTSTATAPPVEAPELAPQPAPALAADQRGC